MQQERIVHSITRRREDLPASGISVAKATSYSMAEKFSSFLEIGCIFTILAGSLLLSVFLGGCSELNKGDIDLGLKAKIETTKSSSSSPLEKGQPTQGNEGQ